MPAPSRERRFAGFVEDGMAGRESHEDVADGAVELEGQESRYLHGQDVSDGGNRKRILRIGLAKCPNAGKD